MGIDMAQNETPLLDYDGRRVDYHIPVIEDPPMTHQPSVQHWNQAMSVEGAQEVIEYLLDTQREAAIPLLPPLLPALLPLPLPLLLPALLLLSLSLETTPSRSLSPSALRLLCWWSRTASVA